MIAQSDVTAWSAIAPWATPDQVEQDLVLSRLMGHGKVWFGPRGPLRRHHAALEMADTILPMSPGDLPPIQGFECRAVRVGMPRHRRHAQVKQGVLPSSWSANCTLNRRRFV